MLELIAGLVPANGIMKCNKIFGYLSAGEKTNAEGRQQSYLGPSTKRVK